MSYQKTTWQKGDIITAEKLNNIENGVKNQEPLYIITHIDDSSYQSLGIYSGSTQITANEIIETYMAKRPCYLLYSIPLEEESLDFIIYYDRLEKIINYYDQVDSETIMTGVSLTFSGGRIHNIYVSKDDLNKPLEFPINPEKDIILNLSPITEAELAQITENEYTGENGNNFAGLFTEDIVFIETLYSMFEDEEASVNYEIQINNHSFIYMTENKDIFTDFSSANAIIEKHLGGKYVNFKCPIIKIDNQVENVIGFITFNFSILNMQPIFNSNNKNIGFLLPNNKIKDTQIRFFSMQKSSSQESNSSNLIIEHTSIDSQENYTLNITQAKLLKAVQNNKIIIYKQKHNDDSWTYYYFDEFWYGQDNDGNNSFILTTYFPNGSIYGVISLLVNNNKQLLNPNDFAVFHSTTSSAE